MTNHLTQHGSSQASPPQHVDPSKKRPKVLIIGGGLGGLSLGMLLQQTDIPYEIFERASEPKALGSAIVLSAATDALFKQCKIYDEFASLGKKVHALQVIANEQRRVDYKMDFSSQEELLGAIGHVIARPVLHDLLFRQIPKDRIHMNKKVLSTDDQSDKGITVTFSDGTSTTGDILIGADGAYSAVRQNLFKRLKAQNKLAAADDVPLPYSTICLVGQTRPLDPALFPHLLKDDCQFVKTLGENKPWVWITLTTAQGTVCWSIVRFVEESHTSMDDKNKDAGVDQEWGPEAAEAMCNEVRHFPVMSGNESSPWSVGDLIDHTPKDLISKVKLEEIVFQTWFGGRTVLMGDACHKLSPAGGVGCQNAMQDAIVLANWINALPSSPTTEDIEKAFQSYQDERMPFITAAANSTRFFSTMASGGIVANIIRFCVKHMPEWAKRRMVVTLARNRPQCSFLPLVEDKGSIPPAFQPSLFAAKPKMTVSYDAASV
ncbi:hypothetical protein BGZ97_007390 [Linnemannia gamsii]|uniref:FAD-binding domain-containing protein n=1 Tax=Linnemannia gamsii TaxID=64522 RepID=A0A9P6RAP3_9FUNG|nr:hypothetical protein BGZ97_007390 [Linnemannia gamsii]